MEITQATPQGEHVVRTLGAGDAFGELALIDDFQRSGSARVAAPARLLILYKTDFDALMDGENINKNCLIDLKAAGVAVD